MNTRQGTNDNISVENVLFATDFSLASLQALPYAAGIARQFSSKLHIAHVVPPEDYPSGLNSLDEAARVACQAAQLKLNTLIDCDLLHDIPHATLVSHGDI